MVIFEKSANASLTDQQRIHDPAGDGGGSKYSPSEKTHASCLPIQVNKNKYSRYSNGMFLFSNKNMFLKFCYLYKVLNK